MDTIQQPRVEVMASKAAACKDAVSMMKLYDNWSDEYDNDLDQLSFAESLLHIAHIAAKYAPDLQCQVLDVCAGTGMSGEALRGAGYKNIDAIDGSKEMLERARDKRLYGRLFHEIIGEDKVNSCPPESYDMLFACGAFVPNHMSGVHLLPLLSLLRPGGIFIVQLRERWRGQTYGQQLQADLTRLEAEGKWRRVACEDYSTSKPGLSSTVFVFSKP